MESKIDGIVVNENEVIIKRKYKLTKIEKRKLVCPVIIKGRLIRSNFGKVYTFKKINVTFFIILDGNKYYKFVIPVNSIVFNAISIVPNYQLMKVFSTGKKIKGAYVANSIELLGVV